MTDGLEGYVLDGCLPETQEIEAPRLKLTGNIRAPRLVDLRPWCSPVEDQATVGSCVANAVVGALEYHQIKNERPLKDLSRLFVYYNARRLGDRIGQSGTKTHLALAATLGWGVCPAAMWPYRSQFVDEKPTEDCYQEAARFKGVQVAQVGWNDGCRDALANGLPVCFAMRVSRPDFARARVTKELRPPENGTWNEAGGGHAMLMVGYDDSRNAWLVRNSWGNQWADGGHVWIDYDFLDHYRSGENYREPPYVVGQIAENRAYDVTGMSLKDFVAQSTAAAPATVRSEISKMGESIASDLDQSLSKARQSIRDRLRGPGAGGGYNS